MRMDLHVHTTFSDGELSPQQAVDAACSAGMDAIALTDHDECRGSSKVSDGCGIIVIPGIEFSSYFDGEVHVLGLGVDCANESLLGYVEKAAKARRARAYAMLERLTKAGVEIGMEEVEAQCVSSVIGRPHLAAVLVDKGYVKTAKEAFEKYLSAKSPYYVQQQRISAARAAELIRQSGGHAVLAHPGLLNESVWNGIKPHLKTLGFWGIEAYHPSHTNGQCKEYESWARQSGLFVTSGSDYHGSYTKVGIGEETRTSRYLQQSLALLADSLMARDYFGEG